MIFGIKHDFYLQLFFKTYFNAHDFAPEDIKVTTERSKLTVHASKTHNQGDGTVTESFGRTITLPESVDRHNLKASMTTVNYTLL